MKDRKMSLKAGDIAKISRHPSNSEFIFGMSVIILEIGKNDNRYARVMVMTSNYNTGKIGWISTDALRPEDRKNWMEIYNSYYKDNRNIIKLIRYPGQYSIIDKRRIKINMISILMRKYGLHESEIMDIYNSVREVTA